MLRKTIRVNGRQFSVIGVTARGFQGTERAGRDDIWVPGNTHVYVRHLSPPANMTGRSGTGFYEFVARLAPGATFEQAEAQLQAGTRHLAELHPDVNEQYAAEVRPVLFPGIGSHALGRRPLAATMRLLVGVTALVLLTPALLAGLSIYLAMLEVLEQHSVEDIRELKKHLRFTQPDTS